MNKTLMKGCGIGCGVVALLFLMLVGGGAWFAREMGREYKVVQATQEELVADLGGLADWAPPAGLVPDPGRVEVFAAVRGATAEWRRQLETDIARFAVGRRRGGVAGLWRTIRSGSDLGLTYARFWTARNRALLAEGMGPAEYAWLYGQAYYGWLGRDAAAGAQDLKFERGGGVRVEVEVDAHDPVWEAKVRMHDLLAPVVAAARTAAAGGVSAADLAAETALLAADPTRVPWQDGLPAALAEAFAPHRAALEATWSAATNPLELMFDLEGWTEEQERRSGGD